MGRRGIASFALLLGAVLAPIVLLAAVGPCGAGVGWRAYDAGGVAFSAPEAMRSPDIERQSPPPFDPAEPDWGFTLTDTPAAPDRGLTVSFGWSSGESTASPTTRDIGRAAFTVNDRQATRIDWLDGAMNWRGLDVVVAGISSNDKVFKASCHAPAAKWAKAGPVCEAIVATLQWPASAPVETDASEPPSSQPESAATDEPLIAEPPPSPAAASAPQPGTLSPSAVRSEPPQEEFPTPSAVPSESPQNGLLPSGLFERVTSLWLAIAAGAVLVLAAIALLALRLRRRPRLGPPPLPKSRPPLQPPLMPAAQPPPLSATPPAQPPEARSFCPHCGTQVAGSARFCSTCGKPMPERQ
jgi:hypothetical protein